MRKLLLLLPLMALASCSGGPDGHDLMSNKSFRMTCHEIYEGEKVDSYSLVASPELPQATFEYDGGSETLNVFSVTSSEIQVEYEERLEKTDVISINRESGVVKWAFVDNYSGKILDVSQSTEWDDLECSFETL